MTILSFTVPPLPEYIISGICDVTQGAKHPNRKNIGIFDLLIVRTGCLYVTENGQPYDIQSGSFLILRPNTHHFPTQGCTEDSSYNWLHFQTSGGWSSDEHFNVTKRDELLELQACTPNYFSIKIPLFGTLLQPQKTFELLDSLTALVQHGHQTKSLWRQQLLFQELIEQLAAPDSLVSSPSSSCAEKAAAFLREHFRDEFKMQWLGENINFHPVYIARCMQKEFGCSPVEYLLRYRIEQAKLLLLQTDQTVSRIAEEVGFNHPAYFTSCFTKQEGISPRHYRNRFR